MRQMTIFMMLMFAGFSSGLGYVVTYEELRAHHFDGIQSIKVGGSWHIGDSLGDFRLIQVACFGQEMFFVDMVRVTEMGLSKELVHGFTFPLINNDHSETILKSVTSLQDGPDKIIIHLVVSNGHNDKLHKIILHIDGTKKTFESTKTLL